MDFASRLAAGTLAALMCWTVPASSQQGPPEQLPPPQRQPSAATYGPDELTSAGHRFFGNVSRGLASVIERAVSQWGLPNGYILGEEGSGAWARAGHHRQPTVLPRRVSGVKARHEQMGDVLRERGRCGLPRDELCRQLFNPHLPGISS